MQLRTGARRRGCFFEWLTVDIGCFLDHRRYGVLGLYKGLEAKLLQTVLTAALMFVVYEKITTATFKVMGLNKKVKQ